MVISSWVLGLAVPIGVRLFCPNIDWGKQLTAPTWDFTKSWASNLTAAGGILSYSALLASFAPTAVLHFGSRQAYLTIGTLAAGLVVLAPLVFNVLSRTLQACGLRFACSLAFLISAGTTIWALTMQLGLGAGLLCELGVARIIPRLFVAVLLAILGAFVLATVVYAVLTAADVLKKSVILKEEGISTAVSHAVTAWTLL